MIGRYRQAQEKSRSRFYFLLSIIFIFVSVKWGIPLFVKILAGNGATVDKTENDIIPPQTPTLSALAEATTSSLLKVEGYTEGEVGVELLVNDVLANTNKSLNDGFFTLEGQIKSGSNRVQVRAIDGSGNASMSEIKLVSLDNEPLVLTVASPKDGAEYFGKNSQQLEIVGKTNKQGAQVVANNSFVDVNRDGTFVHKLMLNGGENIIKLIASDKAGNTDEQEIKVIYTP